MAENNSEQAPVATDTPAEETGSPEATAATKESPAEPAEDQPKEADDILSKVDGLEGLDEVTKEELKKGYMRQSDYTRKTQKLSELKKSIGTPEVPAADVNQDAAMGMLDNYLEQKLAPVADRVALAEFAATHPDAQDLEQDMVNIVKEFPNLGSMQNLNVLYELAKTRKEATTARKAGAQEALKKVEQKGKAQGEKPTPRQSGGVSADDLSKMSASEIKDMLSG